MMVFKLFIFHIFTYTQTHQLIALREMYTAILILSPLQK